MPVRADRDYLDFPCREPETNVIINSIYGTGRTKMSDLSRFGVSAEEELLQNFDRMIAGQGYANRSEALRQFFFDAHAESR